MDCEKINLCSNCKLFINDYGNKIVFIARKFITHGRVFNSSFQL